MSGSADIALPSALSLIAGASLGLQAVWCPASGVVLLLALGLALRGRWGWRIAFFAAGLVAAGQESDQRTTLDQDQPVTLSLRVTGNWRVDEHGWRAPARGEWLRRGRHVDLWNERLWVALSVSSSLPSDTRLRVRGYLRRAPSLANGGANAPGPWVLRVKSGRLIDKAESQLLDINRWTRWLGEQLGGWVESLLARDSGDRNAWSVTLVRVLVLGQADSLPGAVARGLRAAGLAHLVALSGLHVGLLAGMVALATTGFRPHLRISLVALTVGGYVCLAGARPSLVRATMMLLAVLGAWLLRRPPRTTNTLAWVAAGMVLLRPAIIRDLGFQLTIAATAGILVLAPHFERRLAWVPPTIGQALSVSLGATVAALPWSSSAFHLVSPLSPIWNLLAVPWAGLALALATGWVVAASFSDVGARLIGWLLEFMGVPLEILGELPPGVLLPIPIAVTWWQGAGMAAALMGLLMGGRRARIASAIGLVVLCWMWRGEVPADPEMIVLDVGQGDAIVLRDREHAILIDGGGWVRSDIAQRILIPSLSRFGIRGLDAMVMTHPDVDHCAGLLGLASYTSVGRFLTAPGWYGDPCLVELLGRPGLEAAALWRGRELKVGRWRLQVLHPAAGSRRGRNNRSVVLLAETSNRRILLTGDLETRGEHEILDAYPSRSLGRIDVLKVGHHGSRTSTSPGLLARFRPALALISCGRGNRYGHPSVEILERLGEERIRVLRTDVHGAIRIVLPARGPLRIQLHGLPERR